ncbi:cytochrome P450 [Rhodocollybia butyracea]|uniref:Cytochrome P450 n=1 Tax=Rhodocollybia butyracea TaxID=206335 RepID=A0A9P5PB67_9AGAR|nr:cytochrome P450 [Rhodocollybia butyracea]
MPENDIISEAMGHMIAGSDTTSISVSYSLWEMSRRPDITAKLQAELDEAMPNAHIIPNISVLQSLVKEGFPLKHVAPQTPSKMGPVKLGFDLMGFELPPGWLETNQPGSAERLARMQENMMPFGAGLAMLRKFDVFAPSETNEKSMEIKVSFVIFLSAMECKLIFKPRSS